MPGARQQENDWMLTLSKTEGIGGAIKQNPEDFLVEEITTNGAILELDKSFGAEEIGYGAASENAKFSVFILQKTDWNTSQALKTIARKFRKGIRSIGFAGTKDRCSISTQLCSIYGVEPGQLLSTHVKDIKINGVWKSDNGIKLGDLSGNRFTVTIRDVKKPENMELINRELNGLFPNYFGGQRFGLRNNNVDIGLSIMKGDFESAAMSFLTNTTNERNEDAIEARKRLAEEKDFKKALEYFPQYLKYERLLIESLYADPTDYAKALRRLPRSLALMFVHSVDSYIFNREVEQRIETGVVNEVEGNMIGYDNEVNEEEKAILEELGITQDQFMVKSMPELNCRGAKRLLFAPYRDFSYAIDGSNVSIRFSLDSGSYATVLLDEFMKAPR